MHILNALVKKANNNGMDTMVIRMDNNHIEEGLSTCYVFPKTREYEQEFVKALS